MKNLFLLLASACCIHAASAQNDQLLGLRIYHENDFLTPMSINKDDNYTGGLKAELITNLLNQPVQSLLKHSRWQSIMQSFSFSVTVFTPQDLANPAVVTDDRPYASYRSWNFGNTFVRDSMHRFSFELMLGAMGRPLAGDAQTHIHEEGWFGSMRPVPRGWGYEIAEGGAFAANLNLSYSQQLSKSPEWKFMRLVWLHELKLGQYLMDYMQGLRVYLVNINNDLIAGEGIPSLPAIFRRSANEKDFGLFVFVTPRVKAVFHNATLTGNLLGRESVHKLPSGDLNRGLFEYDAGFQLRLCMLRLGWSLYGRSREFKNQEKSFHHWGGPYVGIVCRF